MPPDIAKCPCGGKSILAEATVLDNAYSYASGIGITGGPPYPQFQPSMVSVTHGQLWIRSK